MNLDPYLSTLRDQLEVAAASGDNEARRAATLLSSALEPSARLALMHALSDFAAEVAASLEDRAVEITLDGLDLGVAVSPVVDLSGADLEGEPDDDQNDRTSRISLRLPGGLKERAESRAADADVSLNTWLVQAVRQALRSERSGGVHRVRGWVRG